jgi:hypothetical protein
VFDVSAGGEVAAETHGDGAGGDFGKTGEDDHTGRYVCAGETGGESEGNGETVRHADDDVAYEVGGAEVFFLVMIVLVRHF